MNGSGLGGLSGDGRDQRVPLLSTLTSRSPVVGRPAKLQPFAGRPNRTDKERTMVYLKQGDARYSTPQSLAAAREWLDAVAEKDALAERIRKHGLDSVPTDELVRAEQRNAAALNNLAIPERLLAYREDDDWPGRRPEHNFSIDVLRRRESFAQARVNWCVAHGIWSGDFDALAEAKAAQRQKGKRSARTRRTSK